jgi:hypothetical protein
MGIGGGAPSKFILCADHRLNLRYVEQAVWLPKISQLIVCYPDGVTRRIAGVQAEEMWAAILGDPEFLPGLNGQRRCRRSISWLVDWAKVAAIGGLNGKR